MNHLLTSKLAITRIQVAIIAAIIVVAAAVGSYYWVTQKPVKKTLHVFDWAGFDLPEFWRESEFKEKHPDVDVEFTYLTDEAGALSKLKLGFRADIVSICSAGVKRFYDAGVIEPLDPSLIPNWQDMNTGYRQLAEVDLAIEGEVIWVPVDSGHTSVLYRPDLLEELGIPPEDWDTYNLLFDPRLEGKIMVCDSAEESIPLAAIAAGVPPDHIWNMNETEMEMTKQKLLDQLPLLRGYYESSPEVVSAMAAGEIVAAGAWGRAYPPLVDMGVNVTYALPREGILTWVCGYSIVKGLKERDPYLYEAAHTFINGWLSPEGGAHLIDTYGYRPSNIYAHELAEKQDLVELFHLDDPALPEGAIVFEYIENLEEWIAMWDEVKAAG